MDNSAEREGELSRYTVCDILKINTFPVVYKQENMVLLHDESTSLSMKKRDE